MVTTFSLLLRLQFNFTDYDCGFTMAIINTCNRQCKNEGGNVSKAKLHDLLSGMMSLQDGTSGVLA